MFYEIALYTCSIAIFQEPGEKWILPRRDFQKSPRNCVKTLSGSLPHQTFPSATFKWLIVEGCTFSFSTFIKIATSMFTFLAGLSWSLTCHCVQINYPFPISPPKQRLSITLIKFYSRIVDEISAYDKDTALTIFFAKHHSFHRLDNKKNTN